MEDEHLQLVAEGRLDALERLYSELHVSIYAFVLSIVCNRQLAEDIMQETFVQVYKKAHLYRTGTNPRGWIFTVARNLAYDALRQKNRVVLAFNEQLECLEATGPEEEVVEHVDFRRRLMNLPDQERQIIILKLVNQFTHSEISQILNIPEGTVKWKYRKALNQLKQEIGGEQSDDASLGK